MFSQSWPASYASNFGHYSGKNHYLIASSWSFSNVTQAGTACASCAIDQATRLIKASSLQPYCSSILGYTTPVVTATVTTVSSAATTTTIISTVVVTDVVPVTSTMFEKRAAPTPAALTQYPASIISAACSAVASSVNVKSTYTQTVSTATTLTAVSVVISTSAVTITTDVATETVAALQTPNTCPVFKIQISAPGTAVNGSTFCKTYLSGGKPVIMSGDCGGSQAFQFQLDSDGYMLSTSGLWVTAIEYGLSSEHPGQPGDWLPIGFSSNPTFDVHTTDTSADIPIKCTIETKNVLSCSLGSYSYPRLISFDSQNYAWVLVEDGSSDAYTNLAILEAVIDPAAAPGCPNSPPSVSTTSSSTSSTSITSTKPLPTTYTTGDTFAIQAHNVAFGGDGSMIHGPSTQDSSFTSYWGSSNPLVQFQLDSAGHLITKGGLYVAAYNLSGKSTISQPAILWYTTDLSNSVPLVCSIDPSNVLTCSVSSSIGVYGTYGYGGFLGKGVQSWDYSIAPGEMYSGGTYFSVNITGTPDDSSDGGGTASTTTTSTTTIASSAPLTSGSAAPTPSCAGGTFAIQVSNSGTPRDGDFIRGEANDNAYVATGGGLESDLPLCFYLDSSKRLKAVNGLTIAAYDLDDVELESNMTPVIFTSDLTKNYPLTCSMDGSNTLTCTADYYGANFLFQTAVNGVTEYVWNLGPGENTNNGHTGIVLTAITFIDPPTTTTASPTSGPTLQPACTGSTFAIQVSKSGNTAADGQLVRGYGEVGQVVGAGGGFNSDPVVCFYLDSSNVLKAVNGLTVAAANLQAAESSAVTTNVIFTSDLGTNVPVKCSIDGNNVLNCAASSYGASLWLQSTVNCVEYNTWNLGQGTNAPQYNIIFSVLTAIYNAVDVITALPPVSSCTSTSTTMPPTSSQTSVSTTTSSFTPVSTTPPVCTDNSVFYIMLHNSESLLDGSFIRGIVHHGASVDADPPGQGLSAIPFQLDSSCRLQLYGYATTYYVAAENPFFYSTHKQPVPLIWALEDELDIYDPSKVNPLTCQFYYENWLGCEVFTFFNQIQVQTFNDDGAVSLFITEGGIAGTGANFALETFQNINT